MSAGLMLHRFKEIDLAAVVPYDRNARTHSADQVRQIAASIREFGFTNPVLVDEQGRLIAGHGRLEAAKLLDMARLPAIEVRGLTDAQRRALVLADNKLALNAGWDLGLLSEELLALRDQGFDLNLTGFALEELGDLLAPPVDEQDPDAAPARSEVATTRPGDVWTLGPHRLLCGDSTDVTAYDALLGRERADICWTDPPYNVAYETDAGKIANDNLEDGAFREFLLAAFGSVFTALKPGAAIYVAHADTEGLNFRGAFKAAGFKLSGVVIWRKDSLVLGRSDYQWQHEPILYGWREGSRHRWYGGRKQTTIADLGDGSPFAQSPDGRWTVRIGDRVLVVSGEAKVEELVPSLINEPRPKRSDLHPTMKPVALIERMLKHNARPGDLVLDPFGGSGSTLVAADRLGMCARLIELDACYCDVIVKRWQQLTGRTAALADGTPFREPVGG